MTTKHTPGPWKLEGNWLVDSKQPLGGWVSTAHPSPLFALEPITGTPANIVADANLIAASPTMHEALKEAERFLDYFANGGIFVGKGTPRSALAMIRAAIAKAEGKHKPEAA